MNNIIKIFLLAGGTFMSDMHLKQPEFTDSAADHLQKAKQEYKKLIYKNERDKVCF